MSLEITELRPLLVPMGKLRKGLREAGTCSRARSKLDMGLGLEPRLSGPWPRFLLLCSADLLL